MQMAYNFSTKNLKKYMKFENELAKKNVAISLFI